MRIVGDEVGDNLCMKGALTGEPVMAVIIIQGKKPAGAVEFGLDMTVDQNEDESDP